MTFTLNSAALVAPIITGLGQCVVDALAQTDAGAPTRRCLLIPGSTIPHDNCDCGGQFAQAVRNVWGSNTFPQPIIGTWLKCTPMFTVYEVVASITRCIPGMGNASEEGGLPPPPSCADLLAAAVQQDQDRAAVRGALFCCLNDLATSYTAGRITNWQLGVTTVLVDSGQCSGSETTYLIGLPGPCC